MSGSQIASFIGHFNILSTIILAFVAIYGAVTLIVGKLELTLFNYPSHQKHFADLVRVDVGKERCRSHQTAYMDNVSISGIGGAVPIFALS